MNTLSTTLYCGCVRKGKVLVGACTTTPECNEPETGPLINIGCV